MGLFLVLGPTLAPQFGQRFLEHISLWQNTVIVVMACLTYARSWTLLQDYMIISSCWIVMVTVARLIYATTHFIWIVHIWTILIVFIYLFWVLTMIFSSREAAHRAGA